MFPFMMFLCKKERFHHTITEKPTPYVHVRVLHHMQILETFMWLFCSPDLPVAMIITAKI
jgi:hypothetical protein